MVQRARARLSPGQRAKPTFFAGASHKSRLGLGGAMRPGEVQAYSVAECPACGHRQAKHQIQAAGRSTCLACRRVLPGSEWLVEEWFKNGSAAATWIQGQSTPTAFSTGDSRTSPGEALQGHLDAVRPRAPNQLERVRNLLQRLGSTDRLYTLGEIEAAFLAEDALGALASCRAAKVIWCEKRPRGGNPSLYRIESEGWRRLMVE